MTFWRRWRARWKASDARAVRWLRAARDALLGDMPVLAAGTALFAIVAAVPTLAAAVAIYGLAANPHDIHTHLQLLKSVMPPDVLSFLGDQLERQATRSDGELGLQIATSVLLAVISARSSARALVVALDRAYRVRDTRPLLRRLALTLAMALATLVGVSLMLVAIVGLPATVGAFGLHGYHLVRLLRWPVLLAIVFVALLALYRFAPAPRADGTARRIWPGAALGTALLLIVSWGLSVWVDQVANYQLFYGAFGSVIVIVLWFYLSTIALVLGGFVNAELERMAGGPGPPP